MTSFRAASTVLLLPAFSPAGWQTDFCTASVDLREIRAGGPPRDGIPPIDDPRFIPAGEADAWLPRGTAYSHSDQIPINGRRSQAVFRKPTI